MEIWTIALFVCVGSAVACIYVAEAKGKNAAAWAALGFVTGPIALLFLASSHEAEKPGGQMRDVSAQLAQLTDLHRSGALSDEEFAAAKGRLLS